MEAKQLTRLIVDTINKTPGIEKIILFGSRARNDHDPRSDFDIAIVGATISNHDWLYLCDRIENLPTLYTIDLVRFDTASEELKTKILKQGVVLYAK